MRAADGGVELSDRRPDDPPLPADLQRALVEWAAFVASVQRTGGPVEQEMVRRRGRQLAARVAGVRGRSVAFEDPTSGAVEDVAMRPRRPSPLALEHAGPTPWATGLTISAFFAVLVGLGDVVLSRAFAEAFGLVWLPANLLVTVGLTPSLWLLRDVPFWRWPAIGAAAGLAAAWVVLLVSLLGELAPAP